MSRPTIEIRPIEPEDAHLLKDWLSEPETEPYFPTGEPAEIEDAAKRWVDLALEQHCGLTALYQGKPVGLGLLFLQTYVKLTHQCVHVLVVSSAFRKMGIGSKLLEELMKMAREFGVELFHVEVYDDPEIEKFYKEHGFVEYARQEAWTKSGDQYRRRVCLERFI